MKEVENYAEQAKSLALVTVTVQGLLDKYNSIKTAAETLERKCVEHSSAVSSMTSRLSGIHSSSTALEMAMCQENLINSVEEIVSDFSHSTHEAPVQNVLDDLTAGSCMQTRKLWRY